jgi:hypothetical protein
VFQDGSNGTILSPWLRQEGAETKRRNPASWEQRAADNTTSQQDISMLASTTKHIRSSEDKLPCPWRYPRQHTGNDTQGKRHRTQSDQQPRAPLALAQRAITEAYDNLAKQHWFHPLSFQQVQALLTLFSKSFSSFPHGTCLLSVSNPYLA